ncbi:alpha-glucosidase family protein [Marinomonas mediterranea]|jgi:Glycosidases|uniref:Alpha amylase catalytic region n=1 Tax=Marinomonas mediterranea (strain ATCC 700492 / JCM 21426 / NBRC 103028 / MMB-1) TaxID=717774 RepID=F2JTK6_MARM1|nr:alpha-glucosidase family protein [Marinomonas mediterranea]ADZ91520.1 alpha amylase catalytic region [Marinomonas mediterranea MMB-1]WCN09485.1 alpha-glucosidase [Marinomonas mediterranea]WCN17627.1 alpha-glucosidase [Marinomonas mediterranea MMB-1]
MSDVKNTEWWRGCVIYQVYPRSFFDSNGDGIGDLPGLVEKIPYIASLGVDAIWVSPFFTSPMKDFGYDVSDYCDVDPIFGTLSDFDDVIETAHKFGLKVLIDQVLNHTSDQHAWFKESSSSLDNPKSDWYVWVDPNPDGTIPNNWLSVFGGPAWQWHSRRRQYYLHNFLSSQPDLNFHNPDVIDAVLDTVRFWLDRGVDGFRFDTANYFFHDVELRNNSAKEEVEEGSIGVRADNPYAYQFHEYDKSRPENIAFLKRLRALMDEYPETTTVGEVGCDFALETMAKYTQGGDKLHMCYSFDLLTHDSSMTHIRKTMEEIEGGLGDGWPCWSIGNHDVERVASRWAEKDEQINHERSKIHMAMLLSMRGSVCLYQGEELGLPEGQLTYDQLVDPFGIEFWPDFKGRDGCRTPMPWTSKQNGGFSDGTPWLPVVDAHLPYAAEQQEAESESILQTYKTFLAFRKQHPALVSGDIEFLHDDKETLMFTRTSPTETLLIALNTGAEKAALSLSEAKFAFPDSSESTALRQIEIPIGLTSGTRVDTDIHLAPYSIYIASL